MTLLPLRNWLHVHERLMARFLERRGWVVFYLEKQARYCGQGSFGQCWLEQYNQENQRPCPDCRRWDKYCGHLD